MDVQAFTTSQTIVRARESTENANSANRRVRDVESRIHYLDPDAAPFTLILSKAQKQTVSAPKFEWMEKELPPAWDQVNNGAGYTAGDTAIVVDNAAYFSVGDVVKVARTGENLRVSAVTTGTNTITVERSVGDASGTNAAALVDNDDLVIIGSAYAEGSPLGLEKSHIEAFKHNYTEIFRMPFGETGTSMATNYYTGKVRPELRAQKAIEHKLQLERTALFGERNIDTTSTNNPRRYTGGALYFLTDNIVDAGGTLTYDEIQNWIATLSTHTATGDNYLLMVSSRIASVFDMLAKGSLQIVPSTKTFGVSVKQWVTSNGSFNIVRHRLLDSGPSTFGGANTSAPYLTHALAVDPKLWNYCTLPGRDTKLRVDVHVAGDDAWTDEYLTECGWKVRLSKAQGVLKNVTSIGS